jgi:2-methylisocitrate lyase-like PEP mutase family enzyme
MNWFSNRMRSGEGILVLPGAYDALSARLIARADTEAVYCGGFAATAAQYGLPDLGLLNLTDMASLYARMSASCDGKPFIVDADAGHGGLLNVERTIAVFASAGVSAFHIEDQVMPKRCGHLGGKDVVSRDEAVTRVRTAVECGNARDIGVIARTDAIAVHGFDEAIWRANAFITAGADAAFIDAPQDLDQISAIPKLVKGPVIFNAAPTGIAVAPDDAKLEGMGYAAVLHPLAAIMSASDAIIARYPAPDAPLGNVEKITFAHLNEILETDQFLAREKRWSRSSTKD